MKTTKRFISALLLLVAMIVFSNLQAQTQIPEWVMKSATTKAEAAAKELNLTPDQQIILRDALATREYGNYSKTKDLTTQEEKNVVYKAGYAEYVDKLNAKFPADLVFKITQFQAGKTVSQASTTQIPEWVMKSATTKAEAAAKELGLTMEQQTILRDALAAREYGNYSKTKDLTLQEEKNAIYKAGYAEYVDKLKAKLPAELVFKITQFQAGKPVIKAVQ